MYSVPVNSFALSTVQIECQAHIWAQNEYATLNK